jgi:serine/threonine protein kinase
VTLVPGDAFDHYRVQAKLGEGGMGAVYRVQDVDSGELFAVKLPKQADATFVAEMRAIAALRHPHIVRFRMVYPMQDGQFALFMDYVKGVDVMEFAQQGHSLHDLLTVLNQTALALDHAHAHGVVHRDVKHANVMVTSGDRGPVALVVDFGLGRDMGYAMTRTQSGVIGGTGPFMSPEQCQGLRRAGPASDQWALAVMAWHLLNGDLPFSVHPGTGLPDHSRRAPVSPRLREVAADLDRTFGRAFAWEPGDRFGTCLDFTQELGAVFGVPLPRSATTPWRGPVIGMVQPDLPELPEALLDRDDAVVQYGVARLAGLLRQAVTSRGEMRATAVGVTVQGIVRGGQVVVRLPGQAALPTGRTISADQATALRDCAFQPPSAADASWTLAAPIDHPPDDIARHVLAALNHGYGVTAMEVATSV